MTRESDTQHPAQGALRIVALQEKAPENRVALVPDSIQQCRAMGLTAVIQRGAGSRAGFPDEQYENAGATLADEVDTGPDDIIVALSMPAREVINQMGAGATLISFVSAMRDQEAVALCQSRGITLLALELLPRISRAQTSDALSSQALVSGYRATILAAEIFPRFFPLLMTAAGTVPPARVLVLGAGVAGLQAMATAKRLGAAVSGNDIRAASAEEIRSVGATPIELDLESVDGAGGYARQLSQDKAARQQELLAPHVAAADVVITTAAIPNRPAPVLVTEAMVRAMRPGSVIVDLAAETGGNCTLSVAGKTVEHAGVTIYGAANLPSQMAPAASALFAKNMLALASLLVKEGRINIDLEDEILEGCVLTHEGALRNPAFGEATAQHPAHSGHPEAKKGKGPGKEHAGE